MDYFRKAFLFVVGAASLAVDEAAKFIETQRNTAADAMKSEPHIAA